MDIMMVVELMDESLLLLKRLMCWELDDIFYQNKYMLPYPGKSWQTAWVGNILQASVGMKGGSVAEWLERSVFRGEGYYMGGPCCAP